MASSTSRKIAQSPLNIGKNEKPQYTVTFAGFVPSDVTNLTSAACTLFDITSGEPGTNVSATKLSGTPTFNGLVMTLPLIQLLSDDSVYLLRCQGTNGSAIYELWAEVRGER